MLGSSRTTRNTSLASAVAIAIADTAAGRQMECMVLKY